MLKKLSKQEILSGFFSLIHPGNELTDHRWDRIYETVLEFPEDAKLILEITNPDLYKMHFEKFFYVYENDQPVFQRYKYIPQLINQLNDTPVTVLESNDYLDNENGARAHIALKLHIRGNPDYPFIVELRSFMAGMEIKSIFPFTGVVSGAPHVPYFANPWLNGYMSRNGVLRQKGYKQLLQMTREVRSVISLLRDQPDFALGLYTICFEQIKRKDNKAEYGKLETFAYCCEIMDRANTISRNKFGVCTSYPGDFIKSIQNVMKNNPENFNNSDN